MRVQATPALKDAQRRARQQAADDAAGLFLALLRREGLPAPVREYAFHEERMWRFDYCWIEYRVALEVEGGVWTGGRHTRGRGYIDDMEKYSEAAILGWRVLRLMPKDLHVTGVALVARALNTPISPVLAAVGQGIVSARDA